MYEFYLNPCIDDRDIHEKPDKFKEIRSRIRSQGLKFLLMDVRMETKGSHLHRCPLMIPQSVCAN